MYLKIMKGLQHNWYRKGNWLLKRIKKKHRKRGKDNDLIESLTSMILSSQNQFLKTVKLANILSVCSEWPEEPSAVSPSERNSMALS